MPVMQASRQICDSLDEVLLQLNKQHLLNLPASTCCTHGECIVEGKGLMTLIRYLCHALA